jgi:hypothetical protein
MTEQAIIKQSLNGMAQIINAIPGETYANKEAETLLIMQHRLPESDLKNRLRYIMRYLPSGAGQAFLILQTVRLLM